MLVESSPTEDAVVRPRLQTEFHPGYLHDAADQAADPLLVFDSSWRVLDVNAAACEALGYDRQEMLQMRVWDIEQERRFAWTPTLWQEIRAGDGKSMVGVHRSADGVDRRVMLTMSGFESAGEELVCAICKPVRDDHEQLELRDQLRQIKKMEQFGELAAGVAQDVNAVLRPIIGHVGPDGRSPASGGVSRSLLAEILSSARRGRELTSQLLTFARKQEFVMQWVDLGEVVSSCVAAEQEGLPTKVDVDLEVEPGLPSVCCDPAQIQVALSNLIRNAGDAMPDGGFLSVDLSSIDVESRDPLARVLGSSGPYVRVTVTDTGAGMDTATLGRIFEPFYGRKPAGEGSGLGLPVVYGIVTKHGGHIHTESAPGRGTTMRIYLPHRAMEAVAERVPPPRNETSSDAQGETVLVVEDEESVSSVIVRVLKHHGYHVLLAGNGVQAAALSERYDGPIHLLVADVVMSSQDGRGLYRELARSRPDLMVLYMTGYARIALGENGLEQAASVLEKPFSSSELLHRVRSALDRTCEPA